ncbi:MAG: heavy metal-binding domain-containing protein [Bacteroidota bacterium]
MLTTTTDTLQHRQITQYFGIVSASAVVGGEDRDTLTDALDAAADGVSSPYERLEREARLLAMDLMRERAAEVGANAIIAVRTEHRVVDPRREISVVFVMGTAVKLQVW